MSSTSPGVSGSPNPDPHATVRGTLPSGEEFAFSLTKDIIAVRAIDKVCAVHPKWMTVDQALALANHLREASR